MKNDLLYIPILDEDGYFSGVAAYSLDPVSGEPLLPASSVNATPPCENVASADSFYKWDGSAWSPEKKPTTCEECVATGAVSHESQTLRCQQLRSIFQSLVSANSRNYKIVRERDLSWKVEKIPDPTTEELAAQARSQRDALIAATDYLMATDYPLTDEKREELTVYRQALRDVPEQSGFPTEIVWPTKPEWVK